MLHAITCYFNPAGLSRKLENYRIFRRHLAVPLACVELSFTGRYELTSADAEILIQIPGQAVLWQKERLLNVALRAVPASYARIAWLDCDLIFEDASWPDSADRALRSHRLVHLFHTRCNLARPGPADAPDFSRIESQAVSLGYKLATGQATPDDIRRPDAPLVLASTAGLAWAAHREVLAQCGLYDACILGTADRVMAAAAIGAFQHGRDAILMNERQLAHYCSWGNLFFAEIRGQVGYVEGRALHLWHGELRHRQYRERHEGLRRFAFDPSTDIALDAAGGWRWNSDKPAMQTYVKGYFEARDEDGIGTPTTAPSSGAPESTYR